MENSKPTLLIEINVKTVDIHGYYTSWEIIPAVRTSNEFRTNKRRIVLIIMINTRKYTFSEINIEIIFKPLFPTTMVYNMQHLYPQVDYTYNNIFAQNKILRKIVSMELIVITFSLLLQVIHCSSQVNKYVQIGKQLALFFTKVKLLL